MVGNSNFDRDVIYSKLAKISSELEKEQNKNLEERNREKEKELIYAQLIQGMKLNPIVGSKFSWK